MKKFLFISLLFIFSLTSFSQERELSNYEKYRLSQEAENLNQDSDTVYVEVQSNQKTAIINNYYIEDNYPDYRYVLTFGYRYHYYHPYYDPFFHNHFWYGYYPYYYSYWGYTHPHHRRNRSYGRYGTMGWNKNYYTPYNKTYRIGHITSSTATKKPHYSTNRSTRSSYSPTYNKPRVADRPSYNRPVRTTRDVKSEITVPTSRPRTTYNRPTSSRPSSSYSRPSTTTRSSYNRSSSTSSGRSHVSGTSSWGSRGRK